MLVGSQQGPPDAGLQQACSRSRGKRFLGDLGRTEVHRQNPRCPVGVSAAANLLHSTCGEAIARGLWLPEAVRQSGCCPRSEEQVSAPGPSSHCGAATKGNIALGSLVPEAWPHLCPHLVPLPLFCPPDLSPWPPLEAPGTAGPPLVPDRNTKARGAVNSHGPHRGGTE